MGTQARRVMIDGTVRSGCMHEEAKHSKIIIRVPNGKTTFS